MAKTIDRLINSLEPTPVIQSSSYTIPAGSGSYVYSGAVATWTLPSLASSPKAKIEIKNRGTGILTVQRASTDSIWNTSVVTSYQITVGSATVFRNDGSFWNRV